VFDGRNDFILVLKGKEDTCSCGGDVTFLDREKTAHIDERNEGRK
jgi:hypothetical protein